MTRANALNAAVVSWLTLKGCTVWRNNTGGARVVGRGGRPGFIRFGKKGSGDVIGYTATGRFVSVECKVGKDRLSPEQYTFVYEVNKAGGFACVAHDLEELEQAWKNWSNR